MKLTYTQQLCSMYNLYFPQIIRKLETCSTVLHLPLNPRRHSSRCDSKTFCNFIFKIVNKTLTGMADKTYRAMVLLFQTGFFGTSIKIIDLVHFSGHLPFSSILLQILKIFMTLLPPYFRSSLDMLSILGALIFFTQYTALSTSEKSTTGALSLGATCVFNSFSSCSSFSVL